jgi:hypothetical protein
MMYSRNKSDLDDLDDDSIGESEVLWMSYKLTAMTMYRDYSFLTIGGRKKRGVTEFD